MKDSVPQKNAGVAILWWKFCRAGRKATLTLGGLQTRKELTQGKFKDKHWNWGSLLLGLGVVIGIAGPINTYIRVGKFFFHLELRL